jgi:probable phosphoglycerate mutase
MMPAARLTLAAAVLAATALCAAPCLAIDTIYLVRHAEKATPWPDEFDRYRPLSPTGSRRAAALAQRVLAGADVVAVYTSRTTRALSTGMPLAQAAGIPITADNDSTDEDRMKSFLSRLEKRHGGHGAVLIVGHSNTIPALLERLGAGPGCYERLGIVGDRTHRRIEGYDGLWRVDLRQEGCGRMHRLSQKTASEGGRR